MGAGMVLGAGAFRWMQQYWAIGMDPDDCIAQTLDDVAAAGLAAWEPTLTSEPQMEAIDKALKERGLAMPSYYAGGKLWTDDWEGAVSELVERARLARQMGAGVMVCNPDPLDWNGTPKPDKGINTQNRALAALGRELAGVGIKLAFHFHTPELTKAATELHSAMLNVPAEHLGICLDTHWAYRGCGNSQAGLETIARMYADRIVSLHVRQSHGQVWAETLGEGDVDHAFLWRILKQKGFSGPCMIELAHEAGTPITMNLSEAHRLSREHLEQEFAQA